MIISLPQGAYEFLFIVDKVNKIDPNLPPIKSQNGSINNAVRIYPYYAEQHLLYQIIPNIPCYFPEQPFPAIKLTVQSPSPKLVLKGSWDNWKNEFPMMPYHNFVKESDEMITLMKLSPGIYQYKYFNDPTGFYDKTHHWVYNEFGGVNNLIVVNKMPGVPVMQNSKAFWEKVQISLNSDVRGHSMNAIGDDLYFFGGKSKHEFQNRMWIINSDFGVYMTAGAGTIPEGRYNHR